MFSRRSEQRQQCVRFGDTKNPFSLIKDSGRMETSMLGGVTFGCSTPFQQTIITNSSLPHNVVVRFRINALATAADSANTTHTITHNTQTGDFRLDVKGLISSSMDYKVYGPPIATQIKGKKRVGSSNNSRRFHHNLI